MRGPSHPLVKWFILYIIIFVLAFLFLPLWLTGLVWIAISAFLIYKVLVWVVDLW
jgi:hypothetical protein